MQNENLAAFVAASKLKGASDDFLATLLMQRGWPRDDVSASLGAYWEGVTGLCVPERVERGESARDGFLYLLAFLTLAIWGSALGSMLFQFIDHWFPDPVAVGLGNLRISVTWQMASVAVAFPIFAIAMRIILREATQSPERESGVRRWLTYIALFLTASGIVCDLIVFLNSFLQGGLTTRFTLKVLTILVICDAIFVYYLSSLQWGRNSEFRLAKRQSLVFGLSSLVVLAVAFCTGLSLAGTPSIQRRIEADKRELTICGAWHRVSTRGGDGRWTGSRAKLCRSDWPMRLPEIMRAYWTRKPSVRMTTFPSLVHVTSFALPSRVATVTTFQLRSSGGMKLGGLVSLSTRAVAKVAVASCFSKWRFTFALPVRRSISRRRAVSS